MKSCSRCTRWRTSSEFYRDARNSDGLASECKECKKDMSRARYRPRGTMAVPRDEAGRFAGVAGR